MTTEDATAVGKVMCESPLVRHFSFTGSTEVGKKLGAACVGSTVKKVSLELGGNAPLIVFADADLDLAVKGTIMSKFRNAGQTCVCANRILVEDAIYDAFSKKLADAVAKLKVGPGDQEGVEIGPLIDQKAIEKVERMVAEALASGATALTGGKKHAAGAQFYTPTVLANVTREMRVNTRRDFRPRRAADPLQDRRRSRLHRQRHAVRPRLLLLHQGRPPRLARRRAHRERHGLDQ